MRVSDVLHGVTGRRRIDDELVDDLLAGRVPRGHDGFGHVAAFAADLRHAFGSAAEHSTAPVASVLAEARHSTDKGDLPATAASNAYGPVATRQVAGLPNWRRRSAMFSTFLGSTIAKVALGVSCATAAVGAAGAANALPAPAQRVVSEVADHVGVSLPSPDSSPHNDATPPPPSAASHIESTGPGNKPVDQGAQVTPPAGNEDHGATVSTPDHSGNGATVETPDHNGTETPDHHGATVSTPSEARHEDASTPGSEPPEQHDSGSATVQGSHATDGHDGGQTTTSEPKATDQPSSGDSTSGTGSPSPDQGSGDSSQG
jgi:hypothetical protein